MKRSILRSLIPLGLLPLVHGARAADLPVSFNRDIRPIMSDTCFHCHGFDSKSREAGMRLDLREEALKPTKSGLIPIVPGKPEESEIIQRIMDTGDPMPPETMHKNLTPAQKELFRRWVAEGAVYEPHWAYTPLVKPEVPRVKKVTNPIDTFIQARLAEKKIEPSPEAEKTRLLRRVSLDLTGLPPTPAETAAFLADRSRNAYEKQVERLLASPHHGERMAVWWLDIARFSDTVGFHGDQNQRIFPYRDYVINAFNTNKRFDQFTAEQLAGDLLPNPTIEQRVATGYNRLNMMTREGGAQPAEYLAKYGAERVRGVSAAWFGSTFGCAECHDHKFDPIKAKDFYELQSFFADVKQYGVYSDYEYTRNPELKGFNNEFPFPPEIEVDSPYLASRLGAARAAVLAQQTALRKPVTEPAAASRHAAWIAEQRLYTSRFPTGWEPVRATVTELRKNDQALADRVVTVDAEGTVTADKPSALRESIRLTLRPDDGRVSAIRAELPLTPPIDDGSNWKWPTQPFSIEVGVQSASGVSRKVPVVFGEASAKQPRFASGVEAHGIAAGWRLPEVARAETHRGVWLLAEPLTLQPDESLVLTIVAEDLPSFRVSTTRFGALEPLEVASPSVLAALSAETRSPADESLLLETWRLSTTEDTSGVARYHKLSANLRELRGGKAMTMVTEAAPPIPVRLLHRGNWQDETGPLVTPATPSFLPGRLESTPDKRLTRLDLARWITGRDNPITARAVTNRLWAMYFGIGLSAAVDDLGSQGELPSHPELLDWLAAEFRDGGWDLRQMIRLIVTSATYRQSSDYRPELREADPANRLLAAQNPRRLEAEFVRDNALFIAGALDVRDIGGPSAKPYQPAGYYAALQFPDRDYVNSDADAQWRRGVYTHWQRTFLHPMLANFDAPARDECAAQRNLSNTPQQALTLLNDPTFVEAARLFAARIAAGGKDDTARLRSAFRTALARDAKPAELTALTAFLAAQRTHYRAAPAEAEKLLRIGLAPPTVGDAPELAAWTQVARVLLNSQEVITRY
jgi:hypothetical protein